VSGAARDYFNDWQREVYSQPYHQPMKRHSEETTMVDVSKMYESKTIKCADLNGRKRKMTIEAVENERFGEDSKLVMYFKGAQKGLVLNKTKCMSCAAAFGNDTDNWAGHELYLYPTKVAYQGQMVDSIGVEPVIPAPVGGDDMSDDVPFN